MMTSQLELGLSVISLETWERRDSRVFSPQVFPSKRVLFDAVLPIIHTSAPENANCNKYFTKTVSEVGRLERIPNLEK